MRHRKKLNHLGRTSSHRKAMLANMASSLILHKRISTTVAKAKALRIYVEPLITKSKNDSTHSRRIVFSHLKNKYAVSELFREVSPKVAERPGGYTRILRTGSRLGDNADMCIIELVDYNENMLATPAETKAASRRSRRGRGKKAPAAVAGADVKEKVQDEKKATVVEKTKAEEAEDEKVAAVQPEAKEAETEPEIKEAAAEPEDKETPAEPEAKEAPAGPAEKAEETKAEETRDDDEKAEGAGKNKDKEKKEDK